MVSNAKAGGGSEATEIFAQLAKAGPTPGTGATVVFRIVSHDGQRVGANDKPYDVETAHVMVVDGPCAYDFHKRLTITNAGITGTLTGEDVGEDIVATISWRPAAGAKQAHAIAGPATDEKFEEVKQLFAAGDPFAHYLSADNAKVSNASAATVSTPAAQPATATRKPPPWAK